MSMDRIAGCFPGRPTFGLLLIVFWRRLWWCRRAGSADEVPDARTRPLAFPSNRT